MITILNDQNKILWIKAWCEPWLVWFAGIMTKGCGSGSGSGSAKSDASASASASNQLQKIFSASASDSNKFKNVLLLPLLLPMNFEIALLVPLPLKKKRFPRFRFHFRFRFCISSNMCSCFYSLPNILRVILIKNFTRISKSIKKSSIWLPILSLFVYPKPRKLKIVKKVKSDPQIYLVK